MSEILKRADQGNGDKPVPLQSPSEAVGDYCNRLAEYLKATGVDIVQVGEALQVELEKTAANLKTIGELERKRTESFYSRARQALDRAKSIRDIFKAPLDSETEGQVMKGMEEELKEPAKLEDMRND
jgi:hypothetical protein